MHVLVVLVDLRGVDFTCKPCQPFLKHVNPHGLVGCNKDIYSKVEFVAIDEERVGDIPADHRGFIHVHIVDVVNDVDSSSLRSVSRFYNPHVFL